MKITRVGLKNFLSFAEEQTITLNDNLNVIVGANDSGKTNLFRAITFVSTIFLRGWQRSSDFKPYFNRGNYGEPAEVEVEVKFDPNEVDLIATFFVLASLVRSYDEGEAPPRQTKTRLFLKHGRRLFSNFLQQGLSLIVRLENREDYPVTPMLCIKRGSDKLWIHDYGAIGLTDTRASASNQRTLPQILHEHFVNSKKPENDYQPPELFDLILSTLKASKKDYVDVTGIDMRNQINRIRPDLTKEENKKFQELQTYLASRKQDGVNLFDITQAIYAGAIVRIANTRCIPSNRFLSDSTLSIPDIAFYHGITGDVLPEILFRLKNSFDQNERSALDAIRTHFKKVMDGTEFDIILRPVTLKVPQNSIVSNSLPRDRSDYFIHENTADKYIAFRSETTEMTGYEVVISFIKNGFIIPMELAAAGMFEALYLLTTIIYHRNKILLLDEPATNIHPGLQKKMMELLGDYSIEKNKNQVIMITHSPYLIKGEEKENIWNFSQTNSEGTVVERILEALKGVDSHLRSQILKNLRNSDIRSILFARGVVLVEGISDKIVIQEVDRHLTLEGKGADLENNEWQVLETGGKGGLQQFIVLVKLLKIPYVALADYDSLMKIERSRIDSNGKSIKTSAVFSGIAQDLTEKEKALLSKLEARITSHTINGNKESWYSNDIIKTLSNLSLRHNVFTLTTDLEGTLRNPVTRNESKPLKAIEWTNKITDAKSIPNELRKFDRYLKKLQVFNQTIE